MTKRPITLTIDKTGNVRVADPEALRALGAFPGDWMLTGATAGMLLLQRGGKAGAPPLLMAGTIRGLGWLAEVANLIATARLSGVLYTLSDGVQRDLCFEAGALRMANSASTRDLIGEYLVGEGIITRPQLEKALAGQALGKKLGEVLVEQGLVRQADIFGVLVRRTERICHDVIALTHGSYSFAADLEVGRLPALLCLDTQATVMDAVREIDEGARLHTAVLRRRRAQAVDQSPQNDDTVSMRNFLECVDGKRSVAEITSMLSLGRLEAVRIARQLIERGRVEVAGEAAGVRDLNVVVACFNEALAVIYSAVKDALPQAKLTEICRQYIKDGSHGSRALQQLALEADGRLDPASVTAMAAASSRNGNEALRLLVMTLTQYSSFVLFSANSHLSPQAQAALTGKVNAMLNSVFATVV